MDFLDLSEFLESMKILPDRFSNLAFWRGVRKLKDKLVETFEYISEWGNRIAGKILDIQNAIGGINYSNRVRDSRIVELEETAKYLPIKNAVNTQRLNINYTAVVTTIQRAFEGNFTSYIFEGNPYIVTLPSLVPNATITPLCLEVYFEYSEGVGDTVYFPVHAYAVDRDDDAVSGKVSLKLKVIETASITYNIPDHWKIAGMWLDYQIIEADHTVTP